MMRELSNAITTAAVWLMIRMRSDRGQTMVEYGILMTWLALVIIVAAKTLGGSIVHAFSSTASRV